MQGQLSNSNYNNSNGRRSVDNINNYSILELLGKGSSGEVYKAHSNALNTNVAIKIIEKSKMSNSGVMNRIRKEVEIHYQLKHQNIVELYSFFEDKSCVYLVQELCDHGELYSFLQKNHVSFSLSSIRSIFGQILDGIVYLHKHGIIHRDLSWSNILLCNKGQVVKISDFGVATVIPTTGGAVQHTMCGTPNFISPEVASNKPYGLSTDIWSLGCILYTLFVGNPPFQSRDMMLSMKRAIAEKINVPKGIPDDAADLITALLDKNPVKRPNIMEIMKHPFLNQKSATDSGYFSVSTCKKFSSMTYPSVLTGLSESKKSLKNRILTPLNSERLSEFSVSTKASRLTISKDHWVKVETRDLASMIKISPDGSKIYAKLDNDNNYSSNQFQFFTIDNLPKIGQKLYLQAKKFVELLRSKTPKITFFDKHDEAILMENNDFEFRTPLLVIQYKSNTTEICVSQAGKLVMKLNAFNDTIDCQPVIKIALSNTEKLLKKMIKIEESLTKIDMSCFPAVFGTKSDPHTHSQSITPISSLISIGSSKFNLDNDHLKTCTNYVHIENVGLVSADQSHVIVHFMTDNSWLQVVGNERVEFRDSQGVSYDKSDPCVRQKLKMLPAILKQYNIEICRQQQQKQP